MRRRLQKVAPLSAPLEVASQRFFASPALVGFRFVQTLAAFALVVPAAPGKTDPRIEWGRASLERALLEAGYAPGTVPIETSVVADPAALPGDAGRPEGFRLAFRNDGIDVAGADGAGVLYGCLEAASQIRARGTLPRATTQAESPAMTLRSTGILLMKLGAYNFAVSPKEFPFFYDKALWTEWLDFMAENRFNSVALWNGHPFAYFVPFDRFTEAQAGMEPGLVERNRAMLHWLIDEGRRRNIRFIFQFYNIHTSVFFQRAHNLPEENRIPTPLLREYTSYAAERFVKEFPEIGLYITPGEAIQLEYTDSWVDDVLYPAMERGGLQGPVLVRAWGIDLPHAGIIAAKHPDAWFERKYNVEMIARDRADPGNRDWAALTGHHVVNIHMAADIEPFRWWPPDYIRRCVTSAIDTGADGIHLYPRKSWRWPRGSEPDLPLLQWRRDRWWFEAWGRYAWNPRRDPGEERAHWSELLSLHFGDRTAGGELLKAMETQADVLPSLQRLLWPGNDNHSVIAAGMRLPQIEKAAGIPHQDLPDVAQRVPEFLDTIRAGNPTPSPTPLDFVASRIALADRAVALTRDAASRVSRNQAEAVALLQDAQSVALVARYYLAKLRAASLRAAAAAPHSNTNQAAFLQPLRESVETFRQLAEINRGRYDSLSDVPAWSPVRLPKVPYHWLDLLPLYERELEIYERGTVHSGSPLQTQPTRPGLAGLLYGDAGLVRPKAAESATTLDLHWTADAGGRGRSWSAEWRGLLMGPADGDVVLRVTSDHPVKVTLDGRLVLDAKQPAESATVHWTSRIGVATPIAIEYDHLTGDEGSLSIQWRLPGASAFDPIPAEALRHSDREAAWMDMSLLL